MWADSTPTRWSRCFRPGAGRRSDSCLPSSAFLAARSQPSTCHPSSVRTSSALASKLTARRFTRSHCDSTPAQSASTSGRPIAGADSAWNRETRRRQLAQIADYAKTLPADEPLILGGDFNCPPRDAVLKLLEPRLTDALPVAGCGWVRDDHRLSRLAAAQPCPVPRRNRRGRPNRKSGGSGGFRRFGGMLGKQVMTPRAGNRIRRAARETPEILASRCKARIHPSYAESSGSASGYRGGKSC